MTGEPSYVEEHLSPQLIQKLEAGAFRSLCAHLRERNDSVSNMKLMTVSGFCRNCLAKWLVAEARQINDSEYQQALDALGYSEAAQHVYGIDYGEWKKRHQQKATEAELKLYQESKPLWALHDKALLEPKRDKPSKQTTHESARNSTMAIDQSVGSSSLLSNVCCQTMEDVAKIADVKSQSKLRPDTSQISLPAPPAGGVHLKVGIVTVSDRAFRDEYETGDLSGPAVKESLTSVVKQINANVEHPVSFEVVEVCIVPDEVEQIQTRLKAWSCKNMNLILTTGGTGFSARDVTPEATTAILHKPCPGLMAHVLMQCPQPLSTLSRGISGILNSALVCNLPGNPRGVQEILPVLVPLVIHAVKDLDA